MPVKTQKFIQIVMPYNGCAGWSINHIKVGGNMAWKLTPEAAATKTEIIWKAKNAIAFTTWIPVAPLRVIIEGYFADKRHAIDIHNSLKLVCDALEDALGVNDKYFRVECLDPVFGSSSPSIIITVKQGKAKNIEKVLHGQS